MFTVTSDIVIAPGEAAVFCINADFGLNGGVVCDFDFDNFQIANSSDEIIMTLDGFLIDEVWYDGGPQFPDPNGHSMNLDPAAYDHLDNDAGANWCPTPTDEAYRLDSNDYGTPGLLNPSCSGDLAILDVQPDSGIDAGGETITVYGAGFAGISAVTVGGQSCGSITVISDGELTCVTPPHTAGDYDVVVDDGVFTDTLLDGYRYTDAAGSLGWCNLQFPASTSTTVGVPTTLIFGQVWEPGVTEPAGPPAGITAQLGVGPAGSDPRNTPDWTWLTASWNPSCAACGNNDEFMGQVVMDTACSYSYAYRFASDGGYQFMYCDLDGSPPFDSGQIGTLTVDP